MSRAGAAVRRRPVVVVVAVAVLALAAFLVVRYLQDGAERARTGQLLVTGVAADDDGTDVDVALPMGTLRLTVGEPADSLPERVDQPGIDAPEGGSIVAVGWRLAGGAEALTERPLPRSDIEVVANPSLTLLADGEEYAVGELPLLSRGGVYYDVAQQVHVALGSDPASLTLRIDYDGESQTVDLEDGEVTGRDAGAFAAYAEDAGPTGFVASEEREVATADLPRGFTADEDDEDDVAVLSYLARVPYVAGLGWAPAGSEYVAATVSLPPSARPVARVDGLAVVHDLDELEPTEADYALDGRAALRVVDLNSLASGLTLRDTTSPALAFFEVPVGAEPGRLVVSLRPAVRSAYPRDPEVTRDVEPRRDVVPLTWRFTLPDLAP